MNQGQIKTVKISIGVRQRRCFHQFYLTYIPYQWSSWRVWRHQNSKTSNSQYDIYRWSHATA